MSGCTRPCAECPFSRTVTPGTLGGSPVDVFIGQAYGPFLLPCHIPKGYSPETTDIDTLQCAGAAIFRANVGVIDSLPMGLHWLPSDTQTVFASAAEFAAHHTRQPVKVMQEVLGIYTPQMMRDVEMRKARVRILQSDNQGSTPPPTEEGTAK